MKGGAGPKTSKSFDGSRFIFISYVRGKHRKRFIVRCSRNKNIQKFISIWLKKLDIPFDLKLSIDIDPYNFS